MSIIKQVLIIALLGFFLSACDDETPGTVSGGGRFQASMTVTPPLNLAGGGALGPDFGNLLVFSQKNK